MKTKLAPILLFATCLLLTTDILIRTFYCSETSLKFDSQEFNNILSPIISFLGFLGVIGTLLLSLKQIKHQQGDNYVNYYRHQINEIVTGKTGTQRYSPLELFQFPIYLSSKFEDLKQFPEYFNDLELFNKGEMVDNFGKDYDLILEELRMFRIHFLILTGTYINLIKEIDQHPILAASQKQLLLMDLIDSQVEMYYNNCKIMDFDEDLKAIRLNLYVAFRTLKKEDLIFFNRDFFKLKRLIDERPDLQIYTK